MSDRPLSISCGQHGTRVSAVVCRHQLSSHATVGFVENNDDPSDLQAWCDECEKMFTEEGGMTERFKLFNDFALVCDLCYIAIKARHAIKAT